MLFRSVAVASSLALTARGFLVPPSIESATVGESLNALSLGVDPSNNLVKLECKGCPFAKSSPEGKTEWVDDVQNSLMINVAVQSEQTERLMVNDVQIYPARFHVPEPIFAHQVESDVSLVDFKASQNKEESSPYSNLRISYQAVIREIADAAHADTNQVLMVDFKVLSLEGKTVEGLDTVKATVIKTPEGKLMIVRVELEPTAPVETVSAEPQQCNTFSLLCKWKAMIAARIQKVKAHMAHCRKHGHHSHHGHHGHHRVWLKFLPMFHHHHDEADSVAPPMLHGLPGTEEGSLPMDAVPSHEDKENDSSEHHHHHYHHHHGHHFFRKFARVGLQIMAPIFIGVAAGMTASLLGMVVGQLLVFIWRRFYRNKAGRYASVAQQEEDGEESEEDHGHLEKPFLDGDDLPAYDLTEEMEVSEKK